MEDPRVWILIGFVSLLVVSFIIVNVIGAKRRRAMESLAHDLRFEYTPSDDQSLGTLELTAASEEGHDTKGAAGIRYKSGWA